MTNARQSLFQPDRFAHANLFVAELEESMNFYRDVCGLTEVFREPKIKAGFFSNGATHHDIGLMQCSNAPLIGRDGKVQNSMARGSRPGLNHLAFHVKNEEALIQAYGSAAEFGIRIEKALDHGMSRSLYLFDPDGNAVEFYIDTVGDWRRFYQENQDELISAQWNPLTDKPMPTFNPPPRHGEWVEAAALHSVEICGATLIVQDLDGCAKFYSTVGGLNRLSSGDAGVMRLALPGRAEPCLALVAAKPGDELGLHSVWFMVDPGSPALTGKSSREGLKIVATPGGKRGFAADPNGMRMAFYAGAGALPSGDTRAEVLAGAGE